MGSPIYLDANGFVNLANQDFPATGIATDGTPPGGISTYATDGAIDISDWTNITGKKRLTKGLTYFLSGIGKLALSGEQQIGVAVSTTSLSIRILSPVAPVIQIHTFRGKPPAGLGKVGDLLIDETSLSIMKKGTYGWKRVARVVQSDVVQQITMVRTPYGWGAYFSAT